MPRLNVGDDALTDRPDNAHYGQQRADQSQRIDLPRTGWSKAEAIQDASTLRFDRSPSSP